MDLKEEEILGPAVATHWYYLSKGRVMRSFLGDFRADEVLDVGAGSGVFSRQLLDAGICRRAVCVDPWYPDERVEAHGNHEIEFRRSVEQVPQRLILMMDVLEHVDDDVGLLREYCDRMPSDGMVLITVPAFQFLWSGHDVFLEHRRRYTATSLQAAVRAADLEVVRWRYFFGLLFPVVAALRWNDRRRMDRGQIEPKSAIKKYPATVNRVLTLVHDLERIVLFPFNRLAGLTVICLARRRR